MDPTFWTIFIRANFYIEPNFKYFSLWLFHPLVRGSLNRNGFTTENNICNVLHKGFRISSIKNEPENQIPKITEIAEIQTIDLNNNLSDITTNSLGFPTIVAGSSRKKNQKRKISTFLSSWISSQISSENGRPAMHGEKILIFIEYLNHPTFIIFMDLGRKVKFLKQTIKKTLEKLNYHAPDVKDIRLIFNAKERFITIF